MRLFNSLLFFIVLALVLILKGYAFAESTIEFKLNGDKDFVYFLIINPDGNKTGFDIVEMKGYDEIDGTFGDSVLGCDGCEPGYVEIATAEAIFEGGDGIYIIKPYAKSLTSFTLAGMVYVDGAEFFGAEGVLDTDTFTTFELVVASEQVPPIVLTRVSTPSSLIQDIKLSRKIGWIDSDGIMNSLLKKAEASFASTERGRSNSATSELEALIKEVKAQRGKHINEKAATIITEDAQYLIDNM